MIKVVLILGVAVMAVTAVFGVLNLNLFKAERELKEQTGRELKVVKGELADAEDTLADTKEKLGTLKDERDETSAKLSNLKADLESKKDSAKNLEASVEESELKLKEFKIIQDRIGARSVEDLKDKLQQMEQDATNKKAELEKLDGELAVANQTSDSDERAIERHIEKQQIRSAGISRNAFEATITAVNTDWGFVIIDAGSNSGVKPDSPLLVNANGQRIAKLYITSISPDMTIADIDWTSVPPGQTIQPGYRVLYENVNE